MSERERLSPDRNILTPAKLYGRMSVKDISTIFSDLLDTVYAGKSDTSDGHPAEKFEEMMIEGKMFPFIVLDGNKAVGCCAWRWYDPKFDFGNACLLPSHRGELSSIKGHDLYLAADEWVKKVMNNRFAYNVGGFRLPESGAIAFNKTGWFPCWIAPLASWGNPSEPLEEPGRQQEFLILGERYKLQFLNIPDKVYLPSQGRLAKQILGHWEELAEYSGQSKQINFEIKIKSLSKIVLNPTRGDTERIRFETAISDFEDTNISELTQNVFTGNMKDFPKTRLIFVDVPVEDEGSTQIQNQLLEQGFVFCGIIPGITNALYVDRTGREKTYSRKSMNVYALLRQDVKRALDRPPQMRFANSKYQALYDSVVQNWFN